MDVRRLIGSWPVVRQLTGRDRLGLGASAQSPRSAGLAPRLAEADRVVKSVCPYCAVGCGQNVYVRDELVTQIEGDPDSPISRGRLCPKGSASLSLVNNPQRLTKVRYRRPYGTEWEEFDLDTAMNMVADRVLATRDATWEDRDEDHVYRRTLGFGSLGGATLDNEENYLIKKLFTALGALQIDVPRDGLVAAFGGTDALSSSLARRATASSVSNSTMRRRAATSSAWSVEVMPGSWPVSIRSWRRQT
jgi:formate dehydrogenase major subunit